jgi:hypothetical protein
MKSKLALLPSALALALGAGLLTETAVAQGPGMGTGMAGGRPVMALFEELAPQIGERLPDLTIVDAAGNAVNIRDLPGENYTVLVLGCLT